METSFLTFPLSAIKEFELRLANLDSTSSLTEKAEACELLGTAQLYNGKVRASIKNFEKALLFLTQLTKKDRTFIRLSVLAGIAYYRLGDFESAERVILPIFAIPHNIDQDLRAIAYNNIACIRICQNRLKDATDKSKEAVNIASTLYGPDSKEYFKFVRVLILTYIKSSQFQRAEALVDETGLSSEEKVMFNCAIKFGNGSCREAEELLCKDPDPDDIAIAAAKAAAAGTKATVENGQMCLFPRAETNGPDFLPCQRLYNRASFAARNGQFAQARRLLDQSIAAFSTLATQLEAAKEAEAKAKPDFEQSFLALVDEPHCVCATAEAALLPVALLSHLLVSRTEIELLQAPLRKAQAIQRGEPLGAVSVDSLPFHVMRADLERAVQKFTWQESTSLDRWRTRTMPFDSENYARELQKEMVCESKGNLHLLVDEPAVVSPHPQAASAKQGNAPKGRGQLEMLKSVKLPSSPMPPPRTGSAELLMLMDEKSSFDDEYVDGRKTSAAVMNQNFDLAATEDLVSSYRAVAVLGGSDQEVIDELLLELSDALSIQYGKTFCTKTGQVLSGPVVRNSQYVSSLHDPSTVRGEVMPLARQYGRDEMACLVQWSLCMTGSFGFGPMAMSSKPIKLEQLHTTENIKNKRLAKNVKKDETNEENVPTTAAAVDKDTLKEVKLRLAEAEMEYSKKFDDESKYQPGERESRLLLNAAIAKTAAQVGHRKEALQAIEKMESLMLGIVSNASDPEPLEESSVSHRPRSQREAARRNKALRIGHMDGRYQALVRRFRVDFEEWDRGQQVMGFTSEKKSVLLMGSLSAAKEYYHAAAKVGEQQLLRDALRKLANIYLEISQVDIIETKKRNELQGDDDVKIVPLAEGTRELLEAYSQQEVDELEKKDVAWVKRFGKALAARTMRRLRGTEEE